MTLRNDRRLGVCNGNRGVVLDVDTDERTMRVQLPNRVVGYVHLSRLEPLEVDRAGAFEPLYYGQGPPERVPHPLCVQLGPGVRDHGPRRGLTVGETLPEEFE